MKRLNKKVGSMEYDGLIVDNTPVADVVSVSLASGNGEIKRGTVVSGTPGADFSPIAANATTAQSLYIIADDVDTGAESGAAVNSTAYRTGHFNRNALIVGTGYTLTDSDEELLRKGGILLSDALEN